MSTFNEYYDRTYAAPRPVRLEKIWGSHQKKYWRRRYKKLTRRRGSSKSLYWGIRRPFWLCVSRQVASHREEIEKLLSTIVVTDMSLLDVIYDSIGRLWDRNFNHTPIWTIPGSQGQEERKVKLIFLSYTNVLIELPDQD